MIHKVGEMELVIRKVGAVEIKAGAKVLRVAKVARLAREVGTQ